MECGDCNCVSEKCLITNFKTYMYLSEVTRTLKLKKYIKMIILIYNVEGIQTKIVDIDEEAIIRMVWDFNTTF